MQFLSFFFRKKEAVPPPLPLESEKVSGEVASLHVLPAANLANEAIETFRTNLPTLEEAREFISRCAFFLVPRQEVEASCEKLVDVQCKLVKSLEAEHLEYLDRRAKDIAGEREEQREREKDLWTELKNVEQRLFALQSDQLTSEAAVDTAAACIHGAEYEYAKLRLRDREQFSQQEEIGKIRHAIEVAEKKLQIAENAKIANAEAIKERIADLRKLLDEEQHRAARAAEGSDALQRIGVSRNVSSFLIWASYFSLPAIGIGMAELLKDLLASPTNPAILRARAETFINGVKGLWGVLEFLGLAVATVLCFLALFVGIVLVVRSIVLKLDPRWDERRADSRRRGDAADESFSEWISLFDVSGGRITKKLGAIRHKDFVQLVALAPIFFLGLCIAIGMIVWAPEPGHDATGVTRSLTGIYVGCAYCLMAISGFLVFYSNVIAPARNGEPVHAGYKIMFGIVALAPIVALAGRAWKMGSTPPSHVLSWTFLTAAMLACFVGLAFGTIYRGVFKRQEYAERRLQHSLLEISNLRRAPTMAELIEWPETKTIETTSPALSITTLSEQDRRNRWRLAALATPEQLTSLNHAAESHAQKSSASALARSQYDVILAEHKDAREQIRLHTDFLEKVAERRLHLLTAADLARAGIASYLEKLQIIVSEVYAAADLMYPPSDSKSTPSGGPASPLALTQANKS